MNRSDDPKKGLVHHLANFLNKKYAKQWRIDMPKGKYQKVHPEDFATHEQMEVAAYYQWQNRGCPPDDSLTDWVNARQELTRTTL
jgi:hypothetical protein